MKKLSVLFLIAILGLGGWALPAGAEKIRLTDAEMDGITAGSNGNPFPCISPLCVPPPTSIACCAFAGIAFGGGAAGSGPPLNGFFSAGGGSPLPRPLQTALAGIMAEGMTPMTGSFSIFFEVPGAPRQCIGFPPKACVP